MSTDETAAAQTMRRKTTPKSSSPLVLSVGYVQSVPKAFFA